MIRKIQVWVIENAREKAGRKGGKATAKSHDKDFYRENGKKMCPKLVVVRLKYTLDWGNLPPAK